MSGRVEVSVDDRVLMEVGGLIPAKRLPPICRVSGCRNVGLNMRDATMTMADRPGHPGFEVTMRTYLCDEHIKYFESEDTPHA